MRNSPNQVKGGVCIHFSHTLILRTCSRCHEGRAVIGASMKSFSLIYDSTWQYVHCNLLTLLLSIAQLPLQCRAIVWTYVYIPCPLPSNYFVVIAQSLMSPVLAVIPFVSSKNRLTSLNRCGKACRCENWNVRKNANEQGKWGFQRNLEKNK